MSFSLNVKADFKEVEKMLTRAQREVLPKATSRALNVTAKAVQSTAVKLIAKDLGVTQKEVRKAMKFQKATWRNLFSSIQATGKRIPLIALKARQVKKGVTYRGKGGQRQTIPGAFIATMPKQGKNQDSQHRGVFVRKGKKRLPLREPLGVSIPYIFIQEAISRAMIQVAQERWGKEFPHQVRFYLNRAGYRTT